MGTMTEEERATRCQQQVERFHLLQPYLAEGVTVTHTVCCGILKEHVVVDFGQFGTGPIGMIWLSGYPTGDTMRIDGDAFVLADDIAPLSITHVNRVPIDCLEMIGKKQETPFQLLDVTITDVPDEDIAKLPRCETCKQVVFDKDEDLPF
jgi:hypothetical protein